MGKEKIENQAIGCVLIVSLLLIFLMVVIGVIQSKEKQPKPKIEEPKQEPTYCSFFEWVGYKIQGKSSWEIAGKYTKVISYHIIDSVYCYSVEHQGYNSVGGVLVPYNYNTYFRRYYFQGNFITLFAKELRKEQYDTLYFDKNNELIFK